MSGETMTGLRIELFHSQHASGAGPFGGAHQVTIVGTVDHVYPADLSKREVRPLSGDERGPFTPDDDAPAAVLVYRNMGDERLVHVEPLHERGEGFTPYMAGGGYAGTSDSRFRRLVGFYGAVSVHDYAETWKHYDSMTRD